MDGNSVKPKGLSVRFDVALGIAAVIALLAYFDGHILTQTECMLAGAIGILLVVGWLLQDILGTLSGILEELRKR